MSEDREPIIDALLEELLGGEQPPDLTHRILDAYDESTDSSIDVRVGKVTSSKTTTSSNARPVSRKRRTATPVPTRRRKSKWQTWVSAAIVLIAASGFAYWATNFDKAYDQTNIKPYTKHLGGDPSTELRVANIPSPDPVEEFENQEEWTNPATNESDFPPAATIADSSDEETVEPELEPIEFRRSLDLETPLSDQKIIAFVNKRLKEKWDANRSIRPMRAVQDDVWFHRTTQFLLGRAPGGIEQQRFGRTLDRELAIEQLMATKGFEARWANFLITVLVGDDNADSNVVDVKELNSYLVQSIGDNKPYDQLAFELITAVGSNKANAEDFNPATNFLLANQQIEWVDDKAKDAHRLGAAEKVSQVFLGKQLQCARCHNHEQLTQDQYYQMLSFFAQMRPTNAKQKGSASRITDVDVVSETDAKSDEADLYYVRSSDGTGASAYPVFLDGREVATKSGRIRDINRRKKLADMIVATDEFSAAFVNRLWDEAFGSGFTRPIDDMGSHNPPSHPELLRDLAEQFRNNEFDMRALMKWIVLSQAFDRGSRSMNDQLVGRPDAFSSFARQDATLSYPSVGWTLAQFAKAARAEGQFDPRTTLGNLGGGEKKRTSSPEQQARELAHVNAKTQFIKDNYGNLIRHLARNEKMTDRQRVVHMFLATVGRIPTAYERKHGMNILKHSSNLESAIQDVGVVLLNSKEFITQH